MKHEWLLGPMAVLAMIASQVQAAERNRATEASIPFASNGGVDDWRAEGTGAIWFKDNRGRWFRAELFGPAFDLPYVEQIAIDSRPNGTLDKWGAILVHGHRYAFRTFERVPGPPPASRRHGRNKQT